MAPRRELLAFAAVLAALLTTFLAEALVGGKVLSPADVVFAEASFDGFKGPGFEPANRLLIDPVLQFQPWLEFSRSMLRRGRLPTWNPLVGCGAPHLANGQAAVFDPFQLIAYLGTLPEAYAWMAAARLWVAGLGMFLLARAWGLGPWGRWFAGLAFPFCGFLVVWLLYPVANVAIWMPWLFWASDRALERRRSRDVGTLALVVGAVLLGGHIQTSAHVLLAGLAYVAWRHWRGIEPRALIAWAGGVLLGVGIAAVEIIPLGFYLARSPVWADRAAEAPSAWTIVRPRLLDAACTALPYLFGSQRRGHPNLARALGVHNLNESAGGYAGLATLIWLAPLALGSWRGRPRVRFLAALVSFGFLGAFGWPPVANLLRALPVLGVADNRRLSLWVAFGLVLLGGVGLDRLRATSLGRSWGCWAAAWAFGSIALATAGLAVGRAGPILEARALDHYARAAVRTPGAGPLDDRARAERQVAKALSFLPRYAWLTAGQGLGLAALAFALRRGWLGTNRARSLLLVWTLIDLFGFGRGLNPAIARGDDRPLGAVIAYLRREVPPPARIVAVGAELPPNLLMRYGLADCRNYDSIELSRSLGFFEPLYDAEPGRSSRSSRRPITWAGVIRARERLELAGVAAVVAAEPPPAGSFARVDRVGNCWIARLEARRFPGKRPDPAEIRIDLSQPSGDGGIWVPESFDPGWTAEVDGRPAAVAPHRGAFLAVRVPPGARRLVLRYDPPEVRWSLRLSLIGLATAVLAIGCWPGARNRREKRPGVLDASGPPGYNRTRRLPPVRSTGFLT